MSGDDIPNTFAAVLSCIATAEHDGTIYMDVDTITALNAGIVKAFDPLFNPAMAEASPDFISGVSFVLDMYRRIHAGVLIRHAADIVPDYIPDGMDNVVE